MGCRSLRLPLNGYHIFWFAWDIVYINESAHQLEGMKFLGSGLKWIYWVGNNFSSDPEKS